MHFGKCRNDLALKIEEAGAIQNVDFVSFPVCVRDCEAYRNFSVDFFGIEVHRSVAVFDLAEAVDAFGVE